MTEEYYKRIKDRQSVRHTINNNINDMFSEPVESERIDYEMMNKRDRQAKAIVYWLMKNR